MTRIWKYAIPIDAIKEAWKKEVGAFKLTMPRHAKVLCVQVQDDEPMIWAQVPADGEDETRWFYVLATGAEVPEEGKFYIDTWQSGGFIWHLFSGEAMMELTQGIKETVDLNLVLDSEDVRALFAAKGYELPAGTPISVFVRGFGRESEPAGDLGQAGVQLVLRSRTIRHQDGEVK